MKRRQFALWHTWSSDFPGAIGHSHQKWLLEPSSRNGPAAAPEFPGTSTTPAIRNDLLNRNSAMALVDSSTAIPRHPVKVFGERRRHIPGFSRGTGRSLEASLFVSEQIVRSEVSRRSKDMACSSDFVCHRILPPNSSVSGQCLFCGLQTCVRRHESDKTADCRTLRWRPPQLGCGTGDTLCCVSPNHFSESPLKPGASRSFRGAQTAIADGCTFGRWAHRDGAFWWQQVAVRDDSATTRDEVATEVCRPSCSRAANSGSADACPFATSHYAKPEIGWKLFRLWQQWTTCQVKRDRVTFLVVPHSSIQTSPRRLHVHLSHAKYNV